MFKLSYLLAALILFAYFWSRANARWTEAYRHLSSNRTQVGEEIEEKLFLENTSWLPKPWLEVRANSDLPGHNIRQATLMGPRQAMLWRIRTKCVRRGKYLLGPVRIATGDPFGLFRRESDVGNTATLLVYPATVELHSPGRLPGELSGGATQSGRVQTTTASAAGIRDYMPGDAFNRIHWLSTVRLGQLTVKEFENEPFCDIWLVLDMDRRHHTGQGSASTEEYGVTAAASLAKYYLAQNRSVGLISQEHSIVSDRGPRQLSRYLELLAVIRPTQWHPLSDLLLREERRFGRQSTIIVITPSADESWVDALRQITWRGAGAAAVVLEASSFGRAPSSQGVLAGLNAQGIPTYLVSKDIPMEVSLSAANPGPKEATA